MRTKIIIADSKEEVTQADMADALFVAVYREDGFFDVLKNRMGPAPIGLHYNAFKELIDQHFSYALGRF